MRRRARLSAFSTEPDKSTTQQHTQHTDMRSGGSPSHHMPDPDVRSASANGSNGSTVESSRSSSPSQQRKSATIPFGLALRGRRSGDNYPVVTLFEGENTRADTRADASTPSPPSTPPASTSLPRDGSHGSSLRDRIAAARKDAQASARDNSPDKEAVTKQPDREKNNSARNVTRVPAQDRQDERRRSSITLESLMDPLMSEEDRNELLKTYHRGEAAHEDDDSVSVQRVTQPSTVPSQHRVAQQDKTSASSAPIQDKGISRRDARILSSQTKTSTLPVSTAASAKHDRVLVTPAPIVPDADACINDTNDVNDGSANNNGVPPAPKKKEPKKSALTEEKVKELLQGYFCVAQSQWGLLGEGSQIRYFVEGSGTREDRFRKGGYVRKIADNKFRIALTPTDYRSWEINVNNTAEIWKRFTPSAAVELTIVHNMLKEQQRILNEQKNVLDQQQKTINELRGEIASLKKKR